MSDDKEATDSFIISQKEYKSLLDDSEMLRALYAAGVQDWGGYEIALQEMER